MNHNTLSAIEATLVPFHSWSPQKIDIELEAFDDTQQQFQLQSVKIVDIVGFGRRSNKNDKHHQFFLPQENFFENNEQAELPYQS
jgi:hypothetical protein